jgi:hypothetical protein
MKAANSILRTIGSQKTGEAAGQDVQVVQSQQLRILSILPQGTRAAEEL